MKVAIVHDYLNQAGGAERVVAVLHRIFPTAPIFATLFDSGVVGEPLASADVRVSWMQRLPGWKRHFKKYLPLYPFAVRSFDLEGFDLILSSSSAWAKGIDVPEGALHICYCYTPMRWAWSFKNYASRSEMGVASQLAARALVFPLRRWDVATSKNVHRFIAISSEVARRIRETYGRGCDIVPPPIDISRFTPSHGADDYFLVVSRLNPYKRTDLVVEACTRLSLPLTVVGDGPARAALEAIAGPTVKFTGRLPDADVATLFQRCKALVLPGTEDFGLTPLEANAAGRPVVAFAAGGALETVIDGETGVLFRSQTVQSLVDALKTVAACQWDVATMRAHAESFAEPIFAERLRVAIDAAIDHFKAGVRAPDDPNAPVRATTPP